MMDEYLERLSNAIAAPRRTGRIGEIRAAFEAWHRYGAKDKSYGLAEILAFGFVCAIVAAAVARSL